MKNFNLFEKLWEHSRTLRRVGLVLVMCLLTITQAWAGSNWHGNVFFIAPDDWDLTTNSHVQLGLTQDAYVTNSTYVCFWNMDRVGDTRLYVVAGSADHSSWNKEYVVFTANPSNWGTNSGIKISSCACYTSTVDYVFSNDDCPYLYTPSESGNLSPISGSICCTGTYYGDKLGNLINKSQTINLYTNGTASKSGGTVNISGTEIGVSNTSTNSVNVTSTGNSVSHVTSLGSTVTLTATPNKGYEFIGWFTAASGGDPLSRDLSYSYICKEAKTLYARFAQAYAFIEGRFHVTNSSRDGSWTNTFSSGDWDENSTSIKFDYDATNKVFYRHTYATPHELTTQISKQDPVFYVKTSSSSSSLTDAVSYWSSTSQTLASAGSKKSLTRAGSVVNYNLKINSSDDSGYAILYFDQNKIWYNLEQTLEYSAGTGSGTAPASRTYYNKGTKATAAANTFTAPSGYHFHHWRGSDGNNYAPEANVTMNSNITLTAQWALDYPSGYIYVTDVKATPETKAGTTITASKSSANYNTSLSDAFMTNRAGYEEWAITTGSGNYKLTFSSALDLSSYSGGVDIDVWWGANDNNRATYIKINGDSQQDLDAVTASEDRNQVRKATFHTDVTSLSSIQVLGPSSSGSNVVWFRIGIKGGEAVCSATQPGTISKGAASDGTGTITLTADGSPASNNTWYWQSEEDGTATDLGSGATKDVSAAGTYYIRSHCSDGSGCWSDAREVTVTAADLLTIPTASMENGAYTVGGSALNLSSLLTNNSPGSVTYTVTSAGTTGASIVGSSFTATAAGTATVQASIAATGNWTAKTVTATITVSNPTYSVTYKANNSTAESDVVEDAESTFGDNPSFTAPSTKAFAGWNTKADGSGTHYDVGDAVPSAITVYAEWWYKVYYIASSASESNDVTAALASKYVVSKFITTGESYNASDYSDYALIVLSESLDGSEAGTNNHELKVIVGLNKPILNLKSFFYGKNNDASERWKWGAPNAGKKPQCIYVKNSTYANLTSHPIYSGLTPDGSDSIQILKTPKTTKPIQPLGSFTSGCEGYTLALVPNNSSGSGAAIHELTAAQRSTITSQYISSKYLMISIQEGELSNLSDNGKKLIKNAADYLITGSQWVPQYKITKSETNGSIATEVSSSAVTSATAGSRVDITATPTSGFDFSSWSVYKTDDAETTVSVNSTTTSPAYFTMPAYAVTVAATFVESGYTISFEGNGNTNGSTSSHTSITSGSDVSPLNANGFVKTGYSFSGWKTNTALTYVAYGKADEAGNRVAVAENGIVPDKAKIKNVTSDITLTAQWTEDTHTVSVAAGAHGTVSPSLVSGVGIATASSEITATPSTGYSFNGWTLPSGVTAASTYTASSNPISINATADSKTITATWTTVSYTISYTLNGGADLVSPKTSYNIETDDYDLPTPTKDGYVFQGWYTASDFSGDRVYTLAQGSTGNKNYYAKWADGLTINWTITKVSSKLYKGGTGYTVTAEINDASWDASGDKDDLVLSASDGVTLSNITKSINGSDKAQVVANFSVAGDVDGDKIYFTLSVPAAGDYSAIEDEKEVELDACPGGSSGGTSVYKFQVKTGLGSSASNIDSSVKDASTYMSVIDGGTIPMSLSGNGNIQTKSDSALCLHSTNGLLKPTLTSPKTIQRGDIIRYRSNSNEIRLMVSTTYSATTDVTMPAGNKMVVTSSSMIGQSALNMTQKSSDAEIKYFEIYRPGEVLFYAEVNNAIGTGSIGSGTDETEQTAGAVASGHNLSYISGGKLYTKARSAGYVKAATNEIQLTDGASATYIKLALDKALAAGDIILVNSIDQKNPLGISTSATYSTAITGPYYVIPAESGMIGKKNIYLWKNSSNSNLRTVAVVRPGGSGGVATSLAWSSSLADKATVNKNDVDADFQYYASPTPANAGGPISYSSSDESVATVSSNGTVHIVGDGPTTITASMPAYGCYNASSITYSLVVANTCADEPGTIVDNDGNAIAGNKVTRGACETLTLKLTGHTGSTIAWKKDGVTIATSASYTIPAGNSYSGVYSATVTGTTCALNSTNSITVTTAGSVDPTIFADEFTVKQGHWFGYRLMEINAGESVSVKTAPTGWVNLSDFKITTKNNIVSIEGNVSRSTGDKTLTLTITNECGGSTDKDFTIHEIAETDKPTVAWIATGDNKGADYLAAVKASESTNTGLYKELENYYTITPRNCYWTTNEADLVKEYSKYDLIILTDYPNSQTGPSGKSASKSYTNALGLLKDHIPMLTFEAFVAQCPNWEIPSNPKNTSNTQNDITLLCNADAIFGTSGKFAAGSAISVASVASGQQALQGFLPADAPFVFIGSITDAGTTYIACCERQVNPAARMMIFGLNANTMNNLTNDGKEMVHGFIDYLLISDAASIPDCSVIFNGGDGSTGQNWNTAANWEGNTMPNRYASVRIDKPCVVSGDYVAEAGYLKIHTSTDESAYPYTGKLTIASDGVMAIDGTITRVEDNRYTLHLPTRPEDLIIESNESGQGALIFDNDEGTTRATVEMYSKGRYYDGVYNWQYVAVPLVSASRWNMGDWAYVFNNAAGDWNYNESVYNAFEAVGVTRMDAELPTYTFSGPLASTRNQTVTLYTSGAGNDGFNMIGNSWTAPIQIANFMETDFGSAVYQVKIYNTGHDPEGGAVDEGAVKDAPGKWKVIPIPAMKEAVEGGTWDELTVIPSLQTFEVQNATGTNTTLTLDYDRLVRTLPTTPNLNEPRRVAQRLQEKKATVPQMRITLKDGTSRENLYLFSDEQFNEGFDNGWDGAYESGESGAMQIYMLSPAGNLSISAQPEMEGTTFGFEAGRKEEYTFSFKYVGDEELYFNDLQEKKSTLINDENEYTFTAQEGESGIRFIISATPYEKPGIATGVTDLDADAPKVQKVIYNDKLYIIRGGKVFSAEGQIVR